MARWWRWLLRAGLVCGALALGGPAPAGAAGPWRGTVVDAETGQPVEGVVVLAVWTKRSPGVIHARLEFYDAEEAVTDAAGRFTLAARSTTPRNPFVRIEGPRLTMFKGGYGRHLFRGELQWPRPELSIRTDDAWKRFETTGVEFELWPVKTVEERRRALPREPSEVPDCRMARLLRAIDEELMYLGMNSTGRGKECQ